MKAIWGFKEYAVSTILQGRYEVRFEDAGRWPYSSP